MFTSIYNKDLVDFVYLLLSLGRLGWTLGEWQIGNISRQLADLLAPRVRWQPDSEVLLVT